MILYDAKLQRHSDECTQQILESTNMNLKQQLNNMKDEERMRFLSAPKEGGARKKAKKIDVEGELDTSTAFGFYRRYLDAMDDDNNESGHDEMTEIKELVQHIESFQIRPFQEDLSSIKTETDMLGILASVSYCLMASTAIESYLEGDTYQKPQELIDKSLSFFPRNAACWSMAANFGRITETLSKETVTKWYQQAAQYAHQLRQETLELLEGDDCNESVKEWMELLLLQQIVGVEYILDEDDQQDNENGYFSASSVEGTSRFMAAMLLSRDGNHDIALQHLKSFPLTHRLHPNVWTGEGSQRKAKTTIATMAPVSFRNVLPPMLYQRMCNAFAPDAAFWKESDYDNQGYYSFLADIGDKPKNLIDDVVTHHLLPLAKQVLGDRGDEICSYEWWAHSRQASLGHTLHFDTDEANLGSGQSVHHPVLSSVLHLTGDETSGATIVLDQTPDYSDLAQVCWRSIPQPNTFMVFPGNLLHGVLPNVTTKQDCTSRGHWQLKPPSHSPRRLTFMVGFKTRVVPDQRQGQNLYGPCAPLPPDTEEWVKEIERGYQQDCESSQSPRVTGMHMEELPHVSPAWECIKDDSVKEPLLELPHEIDQRFFVNGPPECFRKTLFENDND